MLKKAILIVIFILISSTHVYAGDIPEALMLGEHKALFIGQLSKIDSDTYTLKPLTVMMGSISLKEVQVQKFTRYYGTNKTPEIGDYIVAVLLDENKIDDTWVFKASTDNYKTLKLESEKFNMVKRYEEYINEGKYFEAQKKLENQIKQSNKTMEISKETEEILSTEKISSSSQSNATLFKLGTILIVVLGIIFLVIALKKKRMQVD